MAHFATQIVGACIEIAIQDKPRSHAGAKSQEDHVAGSLSGAHQPFGKGTGIRVILDGGRNTVGLFENLYDRNVVPARKIRRGVYNPLDRIKGSSATDSDPFQLALRKFQQQAVDVGLEFINDFFPATFRAGLKKYFPEDGEMFIADHNGTFGPANIETDEEMFGA